MKNKKIPLRTCVITHEKFPKQELIRVVRTPENEVKVDLTGKLNGHGAYIKKDKEVIEKARSNKALDRALEVNIPDSLYEELERMVEDEC